MILLNKHNKAKVKKREDQPMKENKKLETTNTEIVAQTPLTQITDNRREITELTDAEIKEIEKELEQYDKCMWRHLEQLQKFKYIGGKSRRMCRLPSITLTSIRISAILNPEKNGQPGTIKWRHLGKEDLW